MGRLSQHAPLARGEPEAPGAGAEPARARRSVGIYVLLLLLPLLVLVPVILYSGSLLYLLGEQARESTERELQAANKALAAVVQRELDRTIEMLSLISSSPAPSTEVDLERMRQLMTDVVRADVGILNLAVIDAQGRVMAEVPERLERERRVPLGVHKQRAFETGQPQISELRSSELDGRLAIGINQPVNRDGQVPWIVSARLDATHLAQIMKVQVGERDAVATVLDPMHRIMARTRDMDQFFGMRASQESLAAMGKAESQVSRFRTLDGNEYLWAWSTTPVGWSVLLGIPSYSVDAALSQSVERLVAAGLVLLLLSLAMTVLLARRIAHSVNTMAGNASRLLRGEHPPYRLSGIRQLDALYQALQLASEQVNHALADRDRALAAERAAREAAVEDNRAKDVFIATLSHELRNPLAPVRSAALILKAPNASEAARNRAAHVIDRQVAAMARLLDDLLDLSRIRSGRIALVRQRVSLRSVLESSIEIARPLIDSRGHDFSCTLPGEDLLLDADPLRMAQVFSNLLTNAAKYTDPGGRIVVWAERRRGEVLVHVMDNGIGLSGDELEQVFQMFTQVRGPMDRSQGGLGIGLWLVRGLVALHGGWVKAESAGPGRGSEFVVGLPVATAMLEAVSEPQAGEGSSASGRSG
ncbi:sensor histidine kinase [Ramlibacter rhizophilus]|uniref:histidine kinase n=1 Tax=Ramlibacter rhizophilus TaxID=1781167 RepID=A0A4Z0C041_9BURK|nr:sensor histidine kinase [Ramlibacter rhizophilus]TFZ04893.1 HAMP domain-containing histidine kinase [Ramlibacter rhizophilus]